MVGNAGYGQVNT
jgi:hypothetical protein